MTNKEYLIALNKINGIGPKTIQKLLFKWPKLEVLFAQKKQLLEQQNIPAIVSQQIADFDPKNIDQDLEWEAKNKEHHIITIECPSYPLLLKEIYNPPVVLYGKGNINLLHSHCFTLVGTRKPTPHGANNAKKFAFKLSQNGFTIVSGLALGIDREAHLGALEAKKDTIAVIGSGLECIYPHRNKDLARQIIENSGLILSEFPIHTPPLAGHFPQRNRIITGLSLATLVVEAAIKSGSLISARLALEQNREVMAIPGSINNPQARGCHHLIKQGATLITTPEEIFELLNIREMDFLPKSVNPVNEKAGSHLLQFIGNELTTIEDIIKFSNLSYDTLISDLAELEITGLIAAVPGGYMRSR